MLMYNLIFGQNPASDAILATIGLTRNDCGRFRDCFVANGEIAVFTRNGGDNRDSCMPDFSEHQNYLRDADDDFDCTYATIYFSFPDEFKEELSKLDAREPFEPSQRWLDAIAAIKENRNDTR